MYLYKITCFLFVFICLICDVDAQVLDNDKVVFLNQNQNKINTYRSAGFIEISTKGEKYSRLSLGATALDINEVRDISDLDIEELAMAYIHAKLKLARAIEILDDVDIAKYTDFVDKIFTRLKEIGGI